MQETSSALEHSCVSLQIVFSRVSLGKKTYTILMEKNLQYTAPFLEQSRMDIIFVFVVLTDALFLIIRVEADNRPPSDFKIFDLCNVSIFGLNYGNLGRVIMLTVF